MSQQPVLVLVQLLELRHHLMLEDLPEALLPLRTLSIQLPK
jgi:hypothetical protein